MEQFEDILDRLTTSDAYLAAGIARVRKGEDATALMVGRLHPRDEHGPMDTSLRMRCASVTKAATARLACELALLQKIDLAAQVARILPGLDHAITFDMLLSHTSGLRDDKGYLTPPGTSPVTLAHRPKSTPGAHFHYANLNYVLLGAALELLVGVRFDRLLREYVLDPAGINGGPNWIGVTDRRPIPLYRRNDGQWTPTIDGPQSDWAADVIWAEGRGYSLAGYEIGRDTCLMSPHAGLRLSLPEMAKLARHLGCASPAAELQHEVLWRYDATNGDWCGGLFPAFGRGVTLFYDHAKIPGPLIGHAGHAMGFTGGAWWNPQTATAHSYALTGAADATLPNGDEAFFSEAELSLLRLF